MKPYELDDAVARVLGIDITAVCDGTMTDGANGSCWQCDKCAAYDDHGPCEHIHCTKNYSTDLNAARAAVAAWCGEDEHKERRFIDALNKLFPWSNEWPIKHDELWARVMATPQQFCEALLAAAKGLEST